MHQGVLHVTVRIIAPVNCESESSCLSLNNTDSAYMSIPIKNTAQI